jgi:hypothetical protein
MEDGDGIVCEEGPLIAPVPPYCTAPTLPTPPLRPAYSNSREIHGRHLHDRAGQSRALACALAGRRRHRDRQACINGRLVRNIQWPMHACSLQVIPHRDGVPPTISCGPSAIPTRLGILAFSVHAAPSFPLSPTLMQPPSRMHCTCRALLAPPHRSLSDISTPRILQKMPFTIRLSCGGKHHGSLLILSSLPLPPFPHHHSPLGSIPSSPLSPSQAALRLRPPVTLPRRVPKSRTVCLQEHLPAPSCEPSPTSALVLFF